ncbi:MAG: hypothetical protein Sv326_0763 [Candidatus Fermentimicrarchaeum limneticum]|uniref:HTH hxlR-type domain-containing protein n=1 Tax=Fermentimicrarchaeum limneticum TaxID=2795018 RepID=A0A7D6BM11_FERL1|nr:MAG: hypothetical protein Sv326_0763 [Candidatus Fermentimicrarchaeum limneticum]
MEKTDFSDEDLAYIKNIATVFSQKWTMKIVLKLNSDGDSGMGFNELMKNLDSISAAVLSSRLKILQKWGYLEREVRTGPPTRTSYRLSMKGRDLIKVANFVLAHRGKTRVGTEMLNNTSF